jgi:hypothetical protein
VEAEDGVEDGQEQDDDARPVLAERPDAPDADDEQDDLHGVAVLTGERTPARLGLGLGELVRPVLLEPGSRVDSGEPSLLVDPELGRDLVGIERVPGREFCCLRFGGCRGGHELAHSALPGCSRLARPASHEVTRSVLELDAARPPASPARCD